MSKNTSLQGIQEMNRHGTSVVDLYLHVVH